MRCPRCGYTTFEFETCPQCEGGLESEQGTDMSPAVKGGFWLRFVALVIDYVIILILAPVVEYAIELGGVTANISPDKQDNLFFVILYVIVVLYFVIYIGWFGQTPGKMVCKLRVIRTTGEPVSYGGAFLRFLGYHVSFLFLGFGFIMVAVDRNKRGLHDLIAGTCVIRVRD